MSSSYVVTLVCDRRAPTLTEALLRRVEAALPPCAWRWLDPGVAADVVFALDGAPRKAETAVLAALGDAPVDVILQLASGRRKMLLVADMDSTMIGQECIDELAAEIGMKPHVAAITERAMRGEIAFEAALRERVALLKGLPGEVVGKVIAARISLTPGGRALIATMRRHGARTVLASGGFTAFTSIIAERLGFDAHFANRLDIDAQGRFAGTVAEPIFGADAKLATLRRQRDQLGLTREETLAIGDGANDLPMLKEAGLGVAFHGKPAVAAAADARIRHADLAALLYAQGFTRKEFVAED